MESVRQRRANNIESPLQDDDIKVWNQAGQEFEYMKDSLKVEYQLYRLQNYQNDRRMTKNKGW